MQEGAVVEEVDVDAPARKLVPVVAPIIGVEVHADPMQVHDLLQQAPLHLLQTWVLSRVL